MASTDAQATTSARASDSRPVTERAIWATIWVVMTRFGREGASLLRIVILARVLAPADFGVFGVALTLKLIIDGLNSTGFRAALVQREDDIEPYMNTVWTLEFLKSAALAAALFGLADPLARLVGVPEATSVIRGLSFVLLITAAQSIRTVVLRKELRAKDEFYLGFGSVVVDSIVAITLALIFQDVWALVWGLLAGAVFTTVVSYVVAPHMPRLEFDISKARELFVFGRWMALQALLMTFAVRVDRIYIARLLGPTALGLYSISNRLAAVLTGEIRYLVDRIGFPGLALVQSRQKELQSKSLKGLETTLLFGLPIAITIIIFSEAILLTLVGDQWVDAVGLSKILAIVSVASIIFRVARVPLEAIGQPKPGVLINIAIVIGIATLTWPFILLWGLQGAAWAMVASYGLGAIWVLALWRTRMGVSLARILRAFLPGGLLTILLAAAYYPLTLIDSPRLLELVMVGSVLAAVFLAFSYAYWALYKQGVFVYVLMLFKRGSVKAEEATAPE